MKEDHSGIVSPDQLDDWTKVGVFVLVESFDHVLPVISSAFFMIMIFMKIWASITKIGMSLRVLHDVGKTLVLNEVCYLLWSILDFTQEELSDKVWSRQFIRVVFLR